MSTTSVPGNRSILVTGDVVVDHQIYVGQRQRPGSTMRLGTLASAVDGGAALMEQLLAEWGRKDARAVVRLGVRQPAGTMPAAESNGYSVFQPFPMDSANAKGTKVWRVHDALGFGAEEKQRVVPAADIDALRETYDVVVIDDAGIGFRSRTAMDAWPTFLKDAVEWPKWVVLKLTSPFGCGDLWRAIAARGKTGFERCIAIVSIDDVRMEGARVSSGLSWERTAFDLVDAWQTCGPLKALSACRYAIVSFQSDGALLADFSKPDAPAFTLVYDPGNLEGDFAADVKGTLYGFQTCLTAGVVSRLPVGAEGGTAQIKALADGIQAGLAGMRRLLVEGHGDAASPNPRFPFEKIAEEIAKPTRTHKAVGIPNATQPGRDKWTILQSGMLRIRKPTPLFGTATRVALRGTDDLVKFPYLRFGKLFVIERHEIESLRSIKRLVQDYDANRAATRPLSIAVFGPPGAGKSFGVKEIALAVLGDKTPILEFNLSQFRSADNLVGMFHQIRDRALEGRLPVVFWDEFDSMDLYWLQFLLAPMQDGKFQEGQITHPIGKAVFVFAGGTCRDFASFSAEPASDTERNRYVGKKVPDFVSRLSGYLDVLGPNPRETRDPTKGEIDASYPIRRALFLRSQLPIRVDGKLSIDPGLLQAILETRRYAHGSRSLAKLLEHLSQRSRTGDVRRSDLPPDHFLSLHVDAEEFHRIMNRDVPFPDVEAMAESVHEFYRDLARAKGWTVTYDMPYAQLSDDVKDDNRAAAIRIPQVLSLAGLYLAKGDPAADADDIKRIIERNLEILAEAEHDGWMDFKYRNNWRCADRDDSRLQHNLLRRFRDLPDKEREKDRDAVRNYPTIVANQGYRIVSEPPIRETQGP